MALRLLMSRFICFCLLFRVWYSMLLWGSLSGLTDSILFSQFRRLLLMLFSSSLVSNLTYSSFCGLFFYVRFLWIGASAKLRYGVKFSAYLLTNLVAEEWPFPFGNLDLQIIVFVFILLENYYIVKTSLFLLLTFYVSNIIRDF